MMCKHEPASSTQDSMIGLAEAYVSIGLTDPVHSGYVLASEVMPTLRNHCVRHDRHKYLRIKLYNFLLVSDREKPAVAT